MEQKKTLCLGLLAHVDAGKTTLSEGLLYCAGQRKKLGRVDHGDALLDSHAIERARGITIFSKQARLSWGNTALTLVDTPGHADFAAEAERSIGVMDYAVLLVSGGVQAHTETLWRLLRRYHVPTFIFVNKMDLPGPEAGEILEELRKKLGSGCVNFSQGPEQILEDAALCRESLLDQYLETGAISKNQLADLVKTEELFPCFFGSALKLQGIPALLDGLDALTVEPDRPEEFGALVYQIGRDPQGNRLTSMKITGGALKVRQALELSGATEKVKEIRLYAGGDYTQVQEVPAGNLCTVLGLQNTHTGQALGSQKPILKPILEPVMTFRLELPASVDPAEVLPQLQELTQEEPQLQIVWDPQHRELQARLMGQVQMEVFEALATERLGVPVKVGTGHVLYRETIGNAVEGVGHYEPLRHYAEVHILLEPLPRGSGLEFAAKCSEDVLDRNWQRLIFTHMLEKTHVGVLTGSPITDIRMTLVSGKAHLKHTEGGDFRQATYRAIRQGLMQAQNQLLEPYYAFRLELPGQNVGKALQKLQGRCPGIEQNTLGERTELSGRGPVAFLNKYAAEVASDTRGRGRLSLWPDGYEICADQAAIVEAFGYDPVADLENTPDSVFCAHGAGFNVPWQEVPQYMHLPLLSKPKPVRSEVPNYRDLELEKIMEREFGPIKRPQLRMPKVESKPITAGTPRKEYLIVDGYNVLFAWDDLKALARSDLEQARIKLMDILSEYSALTQKELLLVFDGYRVKGSRGEKFWYQGIPVVYTKENQTADAYIEALAETIGQNHRVWVVTSDRLIQLSAFRSGVLRLPALDLRTQVQEAQESMRDFLQTHQAELRWKAREDRSRQWAKLFSQLKFPEESEE